MAAKPKYKGAPVYTLTSGAPVFNPNAAQRVGNSGPLLLQDTHLIELLAHFDRERIPERVVHAKGAGAFGEFELTHDVSHLTCADFLNGVGKKTPMLARFSTVGGEKGSADTARDPRGFALKFFTQEGNCDWVFNNTPVFFLRDPAKFPRFIHTQKRDPRTNLKSADAFWDYLSTNPESIHQVMILFSDRGTPNGFRFMNGYSGHTFKFVKEDGSFNYVQIHCRTAQKIKNLNNEEAGELAGSNPDYATEDLAAAIDRGEYPSWDVVATGRDPASATREIHTQPKRGELFCGNGASAFSPSHVVPGVEPSADPVLQSRLFSYPDTHRYRLGINYQQIPVNAPHSHVYNFQRDGLMAVNGNYGSNPNYVASDRPVTYKKVPSSDGHEQWVGSALAFLHEVRDEDFEQPRALWNKVLARQPGQQDNFVHNVAGHMCHARSAVRQAQYAVFDRVDAGLGQRIREATEKEAQKAGTDKARSSAREFEARL